VDVMSDRRRVVATGIGVVTPIGMDEATLWRNMLAGQAGIRPLTLFDVSEYKCKYGAEVSTQALHEALQARKLTRSDRTVDMALVAAGQALESAGVISGEPPYEPQDTAVIFGSGIGASHSVYNAFMGYFQKGNSRPAAHQRAARYG